MYAPPEKIQTIRKCNEYLVCVCVFFTRFSRLHACSRAVLCADGAGTRLDIRRNARANLSSIDISAERLSPMAFADIRRLRAAI